MGRIPLEKRGIQQKENGVTAQEVSHWILIAQARLRAQSSRCGIVVDKVAHAYRFFPESFGFPCQ